MSDKATSAGSHEAGGKKAARLLSTASPKQVKRWRQYLANERAEAAVYRELARGKTGEEREILLRIAQAESRHEQHWHTLLGDEVGMPLRPDFSTRFMAFMARHFGSVFTLALMQNAESRSPYEEDQDATGQMQADERIHAEVVRGLAARSRERMSGGFRAGVFGLNDGLVSNLALVLGIAGSGVSQNVILLTGVSGLLAGALSMAAGEYVSVQSQKELLEASTPDPEVRRALPQLDFDANELALVYRARGIDQQEAEDKARAVLQRIRTAHDVQTPGELSDASSDTSSVGTGITAALSSFAFFAGGALIPILPFLFALSTTTAAVISTVLVGIALLLTGGIVGVLSGGPPAKRALRQLAIGLGAAGVTWLLGTLFGTSIS
ncbi:VIT1/CCC1 transporter family protein [Corynebacterium sp. TAE3-ERU30]|uniref:VIT1/CCC1 transporter family protein n=1 Tax=Corynebacterium sp. TAE3-ERU30 TaxID=2849496 RepID=UPI001C43E421|nr:VIT1/CCC1 transporter family protein [Corynebacterium sp. TAE3-ERU30]MBV7281764.1 VIT1/CCC1 transporter family protein [Corynebacterium sp. TAE3-ERU30]